MEKDAGVRAAREAFTAAYSRVQRDCASIGNAALHAPCPLVLGADHSWTRPPTALDLLVLIFMQMNSTCNSEAMKVCIGLNGEEELCPVNDIFRTLNNHYLAINLDLSVIEASERKHIMEALLIERPPAVFRTHPFMLEKFGFVKNKSDMLTLHRAFFNITERYRPASARINAQGEFTEHSDAEVSSEIMNTLLRLVACLNLAADGQIAAANYGNKIVIDMCRVINVKELNAIIKASAQNPLIVPELVENALRGVRSSNPIEPNGPRFEAIVAAVMEKKATRNRGACEIFELGDPVSESRPVAEPQPNPMFQPFFTLQNLPEVPSPDHLSPNLVALQQTAAHPSVEQFAMRQQQIEWMTAWAVLIREFMINAICDVLCPGDVRRASFKLCAAFDEFEEHLCKWIASAPNMDWAREFVGAAAHRGRAELADLKAMVDLFRIEDALPLVLHYRPHIVKWVRGELAPERFDDALQRMLHSQAPDKEIIEAIAPSHRITGAHPKVNICDVLFASLGPDVAETAFRVALTAGNIVNDKFDTAFESESVDKDGACATLSGSKTANDNSTRGF